MSESSGRKAATPSEITIKPSMNHGFIVQHRFDNSMSGPSYRSPEEHVFKDHKSMIVHITKHTGGGVETKADEKAEQTKTKAPGPKTKGAGVD